MENLVKNRGTRNVHVRPRRVITRRGDQRLGRLDAKYCALDADQQAGPPASGAGRQPGHLRERP